ncbi:MAG: hypothetical protein VW493_10495 [Gammaproteobacteria bacterium]
MKAQVFVPLYDDLMYEHPELIQGPICAFDPESVVVFTAKDYDEAGSLGTSPKGASLEKFGYNCG